MYDLRYDAVVLPNPCLFYCTYIITLCGYDYEVARTLEHIVEEVPAEIHRVLLGVVQYDIEVGDYHPRYEHE